MAVLEELEGAIQTAVERSGPAVIGLGQGWGRGSGFVIEANRVLTNAHNLRGDEVTVAFHDGRRETGKVLASDEDLDLAVIEADTADIEPIQWSDEDFDALPIGRSVLALANPGGRGLRVTPGFVSSSARSFRGPRGRRIRGAIEHTAPLPRGSSGGDPAEKFRKARERGGNTLYVAYGDVPFCGKTGHQHRHGDAMVTETVVISPHETLPTFDLQAVIRLDDTGSRLPEIGSHCRDPVGLFDPEFPGFPDDGPSFRQ